jgi:hypothetical protein
LSLAFASSALLKIPNKLMSSADGAGLPLKGNSGAVASQRDIVLARLADTGKTGFDQAVLSGFLG